MYAITREVSLGFDEALAHLRDALTAEELDILWEEDAEAWLRDADRGTFPRYTVLGVGDPERTRQALAAEPELGVLMPFHVVVYAMGADRSVVASVRPTDIFERAVRNRDVSRLVAAEEGRLREALRRVTAKGRREAVGAEASGRGP